MNLPDKFRQTLATTFTDKDLIEEILNQKLVEIEPNQFILHEGEYVKQIPLIIEGRVKVIRIDESGREILMYHIVAGESCALSISAVLNFNKSRAVAITEEKTQAIILPVDKVREWMQIYPGWTRFVLTLYQQRFNELIDLFDALAFKNIDNRLIENLKEKLLLSPDRFIQATHQQLANELGTAREVVSRLLKQLEKEGKIRNHRGKIEIINLV